MSDFIVPDEDAGVPEDKDTRSTLFGSLTGRRGGDVSGSDDGSLRDQLIAAYGPGRRPDSVDTAAAAKGLGVSQRTVERWISGETRAPRTDNATKLRTRSRQAATTKRGRRAAMRGRKGDKYSRRGGMLSVRGDQGTRGYSGWYFRPRTTTLSLTPADVEAMRDAYAEGGDAGVNSWLRDYWEDNYLGEWQFGRIEDLGFTEPGSTDLY